MNFVFEDIENRQNLGYSFNNAQSQRFVIAPFLNLITCISHFNKNYKDVVTEFSVYDELPNKYIIPVGVHNDPHNFFGGELSQFKNYPSAFSFLNDIFLNDLKNNKAFILFDNSLEGFHDDFIFEYLHNECKKNSISPRRIIYITGNILIENQYEKWLNNNKHEEKLNVFYFLNFEIDSYVFSVNLPEGNETPPPTFDEQLKYKKENKDNIKLFSFLNKKPRLHRVNFYKLLYLNRLLFKGLVSMEHFGVHGNDYGGSGDYEFCGYKLPNKYLEQIYETLPSRVYNKSNDEKETHFYVKRFHNNIALDSWIQIISETYYYSYDNNVFLSEKTFKAIASSQPFIILGTKGSLKELKKLGYKTFDKFFDESYDDLKDCDRMEAIIKILRKINRIADKIEWFEQMKPILEHNKNLLMENTVKNTPYVYKKVVDLYESE